MSKWYAIKKDSTYCGYGHFKNPKEDFPDCEVETFDELQQDIVDAVKAANVDPIVEALKNINASGLTGVEKILVEYLQARLK